MFTLIKTKSNQKPLLFRLIRALYIKILFKKPQKSFNLQEAKRLSKTVYQSYIQSKFNILFIVYKVCFSRLSIFHV